MTTTIANNNAGRQWLIRATEEPLLDRFPPVAFIGASVSLAVIAKHASGLTAAVRLWKSHVLRSFPPTRIDDCFVIHSQLTHNQKGYFLFMPGTKRADGT
jgi:hypothetical protein